MDKTDGIIVWYDNAWPHLEVIWRRGNGYFAATENDDVDVRVDAEGNILGFMITGIRRLRGQSFTVRLHPAGVEDKAGTTD